ncbi:MAG: alkaline phosphatase family protein [Solirubrobacteraceae bacterium]
MIALTASVILSACASGSATIQARPSPVARAQAGRPAHIAVILIENEEFGSIIGSRSAPYINGLARNGALATRMYGIRHPSLPNYLALTGGSTFGIHDDCTDCSVRATSIVDQFERAGISWKAYMEGLPHPCFKGSGAGRYAKRHDPFIYYTPVANNPSRCARIVPLSQLYADERGRRLPTFIWITPNVCNDMHDCPVATGDRFLSTVVPPLLRAMGSRGLLILTFDEGDSNNGCCKLAAGGHIATVLVGGLARPHARLGTPTDHYSVLQLTEDVLGLPRLRGAACACTRSLQPLLYR